MIRQSLLVAVLCFSSANALAQTEVRFTNRELSAAFVLVRPELNSIELNGQNGIFTPSPALRFFGIDEQKFQIDFNGLAEIADIEFNHLRAKTPQVSFSNGSFDVTIPVEDRVKAVQSVLGSISLKDVVLTASLEWVRRADGSQYLDVKNTQIRGTFIGTGALRPPFILNKVRALILKTLTHEVHKILVKQTVQDSVQKGLLTWAKFYTGTEFHSLIPGSTEFFNQDSDSGIRFQVEN